MSLARRRRRLWGGYVLAALLLVASFGWLTWRTVSADRQRRVAELARRAAEARRNLAEMGRAKAELDKARAERAAAAAELSRAQAYNDRAETLAAAAEKTRLRNAMWRLESAVLPVLMAEAARLPEFFAGKPPSPRTPPPTPGVTWIARYFHLSADDVLTSSRLVERKQKVDPAPPLIAAAVLRQTYASARRAAQTQYVLLDLDVDNLAQFDVQQPELLSNPFGVRGQMVNRARVAIRQARNTQEANVLANAPPAQQAAMNSSGRFTVSDLVGFWVPSTDSAGNGAAGKSLVFARSVRPEKPAPNDKVQPPAPDPKGKTRTPTEIQGFVVQWPLLKKMLLGEIADLYPEADLVPADPDQPADPERRMITIPVDLVAVEGPPDSRSYPAAAKPPGGPDSPAAGKPAAMPGAEPKKTAATKPLAAGTPVVASPLKPKPPGPPEPLASLAADAAQGVGFVVPQALILAWAALLLALALGAAALRRMSELLERRTGFVAAVTHELRTPLTTFTMYTEMLAEGMVPEEKQSQYHRTLLEEAGRLARLVDNVLDYARLESGRESLQPRPVLVHQALESAARAASPALARAGLAPAVAAPPELQVRADPEALARILANLLDNAAKYAAAGTEKTVHLEAAADKNGVRVDVRDHGPGVPKGQRRRLFEAFERPGDEMRREKPGVGLGLALARGWARRMGGELVYLTAPDGGAVFRLTLPAS